MIWRANNNTNFYMSVLYHACQYSLNIFNLKNNIYLENEKLKNIKNAAKSMVGVEF